MAETLLDEAAVVPRITQLRAGRDCVFEQFECVDEVAVGALRGDALEGLDDEILAGAATAIIAV